MEVKMDKKGVGGWLVWAIIFLIVAVIAGLLGFTSLAGASYTIAKWLAVIFVVLFIISVIAGTIKRA
jgi:uncharacterized membrane protein YtjA (UPF0391 family)